MAKRQKQKPQQKAESSSHTICIPQTSGKKADYADIQYLTNGTVVSRTRLILLGN